MSIRWQIAAAMTAIAVIATAVVGAVSYTQTRGRLIAEVDTSLAALDQLVANRRIDPDALPERGPLGQTFVRVVGRDGTIRTTTFPFDFPVTNEIAQRANAPRASGFETVEFDGERFRVRSVRFGRRLVQFGRSLDETDRVLRGVGLRILLWVLAVAAIAVAAGLWLAGRITRSLRRLTDAAEHVEATGRFDIDIDDATGDEVGRLAGAFDRMLASLGRSRAQQQRLVQDAGHELRTPLTSLRTNLDTLRRHPDLDRDQRDEIVADLHAETEELTNLVDEIVAVAAGDDADETATDVALGPLVVDVAERYRRRSGRAIEVAATDAATVVAQRSHVQRAVSCLVDNALKFDGSGGVIEIEVSGRTVRVRDRGPGIAPDAHHAVFERFHRADEARSKPGSGLGLSIVRAVAVRHGGDAFVADRPGGGAVVGFRLGEFDRPATPPTSSGSST